MESASSGHTLAVKGCEYGDAPFCLVKGALNAYLTERPLTPESLFLRRVSEFISSNPLTNFMEYSYPWGTDSCIAS